MTQWVVGRHDTMPAEPISSPLTDEDNAGPWTSAEDTVLFEHVQKNGEGGWNRLQKHTGLARCGKSCRLRWMNHLKPDLKKGAFTPDEELIIELHARMGNRWARIASYEYFSGGMLEHMDIIHL